MFAGLIRSIMLPFIVLLLATNAYAQQSTPLSPSVVLVLKLVSTTHVKPTTGIVISDSGLVLVPADFISTNDGEAESEILVLDGGTDILSNGRPAMVVNRSIGGGLAVLSVKGLKRPAFKLSEDENSPQRKLHLEAFPPAENIAKGAEPLWVAISAGTPLPYVSGPVIDECGYLAGLSLTHGSQSLDSGTAPNIIFADELRNILDSAQLNIPSASCAPVAIQTEPVVSTTQESDVAEEQPLTAEQVPTGDTAATDIQQQLDVELPVKRVTRTTEPPSLWRSVPLWLPVLGFIILAVSAWKGFFFYRLHKNHEAQATATKPVPTIQPASDEPDTALLEEGSDTLSVKPRSAPLDETEIPDLKDLPEGYDGILVLEGQLDASIFCKRFCLVNTERAELVVGRGEVDISIEHPSISRNHARIELEAGIMTLSDAGSNNGSYINSIPCLSGEIMFIEPEDHIFLGAVQVRISLVKKEAGFS